jgi:hypothetical protein
MVISPCVFPLEPKTREKEFLPNRKGMKKGKR